MEKLCNDRRLHSARVALQRTELQGHVYNGSECLLHIGCVFGRHGRVLFDVETDGRTGTTRATEAEHDARTVFHAHVQTLVFADAVIDRICVAKVTCLCDLLSFQTSSIRYQQAAWG